MDINRWSIPKSDWLYSLQRWRSSISTVQFSHSVMSDSLRPHELQHARPPCPSSTPKFTQTHVYRVGDAIQPSHPLLSPSPPAPVPPSIRVFSSESTLCMRWTKYWNSALVSVLPKNTQDWSPLDGLVGSPCSPRDSQESSPTLQFKSINSSVLSFLHSPTLTSIHDQWKHHSLD